MSKELIEELRANANGRPLDVYAPILSEAADALESQAREIERLKRAAQANWDEFAEGMKTQPSGVVLPERTELNRMWQEVQDGAMRNPTPPHIVFAEQLARLNQPASGGDERAAVQSDISCDSAYRNGLIAGFGFGINDDEGGYQRSLSCYQVQIHEARAALPVREAVADGWQLVPVDSTGAMEDAAGIGMEKAREVYRAMLAAAPSPSREGE